jgi:hypothetical protein
MFVLFCNLSDPGNAVAEIRALPTASGMRRRVLEEIDRIMDVSWRRTHVCNMFVCHYIERRIYMNVIVEGLWETRPRGRSFIRVYLNHKSPNEVMADERRLALGMAFHPRLGGKSHLSEIDFNVLEAILWLAGPCLV